MTRDRSSSSCPSLRISCMLWRWSRVTRLNVKYSYRRAICWRSIVEQIRKLRSCDSWRDGGGGGFPLLKHNGGQTQ